jgi:hypothetical protein
MSALALEARQPLGDLRERRGQRLDRHVAPQPRVARAEHLAHAPRAKRADDLVGPQAGADTQEYRMNLQHDRRFRREGSGCHAPAGAIAGVGW